MKVKIIINNKYFKEFDQFPISIGRRNDNDLIINDILTSRIHCVLYNESEKIYIADLKSTNGTFVNKKLLNTPQAITKKNEIFIGNTLLNIICEY